MSAHMKKHRINAKESTQILYVIDDDVCYAIPKKIAKLYVVETKKVVYQQGNVSSKEIFAAHDKKYGKSAALLKGLRARENLSQVEFAKKIKVSQSNLSKMENGSRPVGKIIAQRIAKKFSVNYHYFVDAEANGKS